MKKRVVIESPFGRNVDGSICTPEQYERNRRYLKRAMADSLHRDEAPYASHRVYPGILDDAILAERELGITAGQEWGSQAQMCVLYVDHGITEGMQRSLNRYKGEDMPIAMRAIGVEPEVVFAPVPRCYQVHYTYGGCNSLGGTTEHGVHRADPNAGRWDPPWEGTYAEALQIILDNYTKQIVGGREYASSMSASVQAIPK